MKECVKEGPASKSANFDPSQWVLPQRNLPQGKSLPLRFLP